MKKGLFITFEGVEGSGKTTQIKLLSEYLKLKSFPVEVTREPGGTVIGEKIRSVLLDPENKEMSDLTEMLLYYGSRAQHIYEKINMLKNNGYIVICDRFNDSTIAYQGYGRGIDKKLIEGLSNLVVEGNEPDITFLIDIDPTISLKRARRLSKSKKGDRLEQETIEFHKRVRQGYLELYKKNKNRFIFLDGNKDKAETFSMIKEKMENIIKEIKVQD